MAGAKTWRVPRSRGAGTECATHHCLVSPRERFQSSVEFTERCCSLSSTAAVSLYGSESYEEVTIQQCGGQQHTSAGRQQYSARAQSGHVTVLLADWVAGANAINCSPVNDFTDQKTASAKNCVTSRGPTTTTTFLDDVGTQWQPSLVTWSRRLGPYHVITREIK